MPHHQDLELRAAKALARGDFGEAFRLADHRCRILPQAEAHDFVLRAEALFRMGERRSALADLASATALSPDDATANRKLLARARGRRREAAASVLVRIETDARILRSAIDVLWADQPRPLGAVQVDDDTVRGWAVWPNHAEVEVAIETANGRMCWPLAGDQSHPLASASCRATAFNLVRPISDEPELVQLRCAGEVVLTAHARPNAPRTRRTKAVPAGNKGGVTVIVPVYRDLAATRRCLRAVLAELKPRSPHRLIVVDDATPEPAIAEYLAGLTGHPGVTVLTNDYNRGFVGSVNRAMRATTRRDLILLNSDAVPPTGFIDRLVQAARTDPDIGTVVPLSNNAELTSFPRADRSNPLPHAARIAELDRIAARMNPGVVVDLPSGTGFCLYITAACRAEVGELSHAFDKGYFEDVDFTLRARQRGFRSVCAPSIYVGHAGSRSFGAEKASLAIRNFGVLAQRFGGYLDECRAFAAADPLRPFRARIEQEAIAEGTGLRVVVTGAGSMAEVAGARASRCIATGQPCMTLGFEADRGQIARLANADGGIPQSLRFDLSRRDGRRAFAATMWRLEPSRIEIVDPDGIPAILLDMIARLRIPFDLVIGDAALFPSGHPTRGGRQDDRRNRILDRLVRRAARLVAPTEEAFRFASRHLPDDVRERLIQDDAAPKPATPRNARRSSRRLGVVTVRGSEEEFRLVRDLALAFARSAPDLTITVFGELPDDLRLMAMGNVFVTGRLIGDELLPLLRCHCISHVLAGFGPPLFGHPIIEEALACGLPTAAIDWSGEAGPRIPTTWQSAQDRTAESRRRWVAGWAPTARPAAIRDPARRAARAGFTIR